MMDCTAVLMAGGQSSRMGCDKAWLDYGGRPLWMSQLEKLQSFAGEVLISAKESTFVPNHTGCRIVLDEAPGLGPLEGLLSVLAVAKHERVLLLGVDLPEMTAGYLSSLVREASPECGVIPECQGFYQGLAAVYPRKILPALREILAGEDHSFQHLSRLEIARGTMKVRRVESEEEGLFRNWNTPEDRNG